METLVQFHNRKGKWLRGMLHRPALFRAASRRVPGVVFFHGFTGDRMESHWIFIKCARALTAAGIASLRFDFYGSGESEGEFREATLGSEICDAQDAVAFFRRQKGVDPQRVGLCGLSLGGCVAACIAQQTRAAALVLWSALAHPAHLQTLAETSAKPIRNGEGALEYDAREISPRFMEDALKVEPVKAIARFKHPTLIIQPEKDLAVPLSHAEDFFRAAVGRIKEKVIIPGADHTFTSLAWERQVIGRTVEWFGKYL
jgi:dipeptidyl aminopeptidase/acylaminoacyl peptidase